MRRFRVVSAAAAVIAAVVCLAGCASNNDEMIYYDQHAPGGVSDSIEFRIRQSPYDRYRY